MPTPSVQDLLHTSRVGFASLDIGPAPQEAALAHLERWLEAPHFAAYRPQIVGLIAAERWETLLDSFHRVLPFGTGGRRGLVGVGPNRFNPWALGTSVQGHAAWLRRVRGDGPLSVVIAYDVRQFQDRGDNLLADVPSPVHGLRSRDLALIAAEVYAAADIQVYFPAEGGHLSTPQLSFAIRHLGADGGLNVSASHNPPDDNGGKFYNHTGGQAVPPLDEEMAREVEGVEHVDRMPFDRAVAAGLIVPLDPAVTEAYIQANLAIGRSPSARSARVVFTNLHGTSIDTVYPVLQRAGFQVQLEPSQAALDGAFPAVPFRAPNPEVPQSMDAAVATAESVGAHLVMACDPDADRLGVVVRETLRDPAATDPIRWRFLNGNEIATVIAHYLLSRRSFAAAPLVFKTEVTSTLVERVARAHGARVVGNLLVGFKYIGDALDQLERTGRFAGIPASLDDFVLGAEESHGVLLTTQIRDKDAAGGALALAELASIELEQGRSLVDTLRELWLRVGYVRNELISTVMRGARGLDRIRRIQASLREDPPQQIGGRAVLAFHDRQDPAFGPIRSDTDRASRDVLVWELEGGARVILRPSGTEPKVKVYAELAGDKGEPLETAVPRINQQCRALAEALVLTMLARVDLHPPAWVLSASDLLSVEHKLHFSEVLLPTLLSRIDADEPVADWLEAQLKRYGSDPRALFKDAVRRYVDEHPTRHAATLRGLFG